MPETPYPGLVHATNWAALHPRAIDLAEPRRTESNRHLRDYVGIRADAHAFKLGINRLEMNGSASVSDEMNLIFGSTPTSRMKETQP